ncbi:MAG: septum formation initiator family protein [Patescibacteria group bacterium]|jgi:cell division protein FtsB
MSKKYNLSPAEKLNYVQKGKIKGQGKKNFKKFLVSFLILGLLVLMFVPYLNKYQKNKDLENEIAKIKEEIDKYENQNEELKEILNYLESDQAVEDRARINLGLQKEGESVLIIRRKIEEPNVKNNYVLDSGEEEGNFKKWLNYIFKD